jgi:hypothetical protein
MTNGEWLRDLILRGRSIEELNPFEKSMLANLERDIAKERKQPETSDIRVTIQSEPAAEAAREASSAPRPRDS